MKNILTSIHDEIREKRIGLLELNEAMDIKKQDIKVWELEHMTSITNAIDENGKPQYSNDTKRKAELERRKNESKEYRLLNEMFSKLKREYDLAVIELQHLLDKQDNARALTRILGVE